MATSFVQGRLRQKQLSVRVSTACAHCQRPLHLEVHSRTGHSVQEVGAEPLVFEPQMDWATFEEPNIIHAY